MQQNLFWGIVLVLFGVLFLLDNLGIADFGDVFGNFWPLLLVLWGFMILRRNKREPFQQTSTGSAIPPIGTTNVPPITPVPGAEVELLHESSVFGDIILTVASRNFKGGSISTVFGDAHLDLSRASMAQGDHELRVHSVFGDSSIVVPPDCGAIVKASSVFGQLNIFGQRRSGFSSDIETATPSYPSASNRLRLHVSKVFGDVVVQSAFGQSAGTSQNTSSL